MPVNLEARDIAIKKIWLSPDDLEKEYGFSKSSQAKMRQQGSDSNIPFSKIGTKYIRYNRIAINQWLKDHQVQGTPYKKENS